MDNIEVIKEQLAKAIRESSGDALPIALDLIEEMEKVIADQDQQIRRLRVSSNTRRSYDPTIDKRLYQQAHTQQQE